MTTTQPSSKPAGVYITEAYPMLVPNQLGQMGFTIWGLGDDNKMYLWDSKSQEWKRG